MSVLFVILSTVFDLFLNHVALVQSGHLNFPSNVLLFQEFEGGSRFIDEEISSNNLKCR